MLQLTNNITEGNTMTGREIQAEMIRAYRNAGYKVMSFSSYDKSGLVGYRYLCGSFVTDSPHGNYDLVMKSWL